MAKTPEDKVYKEIKEYDPIPKYETQNSTVVYRIRLVEAKSEPLHRIDIREHISSDRYTGFTGRGITLVPEQIDALLKSLEKAKVDHSTLVSKEGGSKKKKTK